MVYIHVVMIAEKATKLGHDQVTRLEAHCFVLFCFVIVLFIFNYLYNLSPEIFAYKVAMTLVNSTELR